MNKRQKKKNFKKWIVTQGYSIDGNLYCIQCGKKLNFNDDWQMKYCACDSYCYGVAVGVYTGYSK